MKHIASQLFIFALVAAVVVPGVPAQIGPPENSIGVFFDQGHGESRFFEGPAVEILTAYVMVVNPTFPEIHGLEFGYQIVVYDDMQSMLVRTGNILPAGAIDLGTNSDQFVGDYVVGLSSPLPASMYVAFVTWEFEVLSPLHFVGFKVGPSQIQSIQDGLPACEIGGAVVPLEFTEFLYDIAGSGYNGLYNAVVGVSEISTNTTSFGGLKALFR